MSLNTKKFLAIALTGLLSMTAVGSVSSPANAAPCTEGISDNPTGNDNPVANLRLVSPTLTDENSVRRYDFEGKFVNDCHWFGKGLRFNQVHVPFGLRTNLTFQATNKYGAPLVNTQVILRANKSYSNSNALVKVNGIQIRDAKAGVDGGPVVGRTDVNGLVNFVVAPPTTCEREDISTLPDAPATLSTDTQNDINQSPATDCFSQFLPSINGEQRDSSDFVELHYYDPAGLDFTASDASISLLAPTLRAVETEAGKANALDNEGILQAYAPINSKQVIAFQALKADGSYAMNQPVTVRVNLANSGATAKVSAALATNTFAGFAAPQPANPLKTAEDQLVLTGTTDAFGVVAFTLNNSDTVASAPPASSTAALPAESKFARIYAEITGKVNTGNPVEFHYYKPIPPTTITAVAVGRKVSVTLNYAKGKRSVVMITGLKSVAVTPTTDKKVYTYIVKTGKITSKTTKITVKVTSNGKSLTKVFNVK